jgi:serine/threonine-protein kinase
VSPAALERSDGDPLLGSLVADRFAVLGLVGTGALAAVYRARDLDAGHDVALKVVRTDRLIDASVRERFEREARILCALESPYTAAAVGWGTVEGLAGTSAEGALYLAMELLEGESLGARLQRLGRLDPRDAVRFACHCLHSLAEAHGKGIVHRDIKPDNLLLVPRAADRVEVCRVIDFGLAAAVARAPASDPPPSVRASALAPLRRGLQGTPRYMAPEQAAGLPIDARADLYSLGAVLYHMLAGRPPFVERDATAVMNQHLRAPPPPFRDVAPDRAIPAELEALVMRALAKEPAQRTRSAEVFLQALGAIEPTLADGTDGRMAGSMPPIPMSHAHRSTRLGLGLAVGSGAAVVAAVVALMLLPCAAPSAPSPGVASVRGAQGAGPPPDPTGRGPLAVPTGLGGLADGGPPASGGAPDAARTGAATPPGP